MISWRMKALEELKGRPEFASLDKGAIVIIEDAEIRIRELPIVTN